MKEEWKDIPGFEGLYQVSNIGRVKSLRFRNGVSDINKPHILRPYNNGNGYLAVHLAKNKKRHVRYVHRLVAESFCTKREGCDYINHLDHNRSNNVYSNLEWCTQAENIRYSAHLMRRSCIEWAFKPEHGIYRRGNRFRVVINHKEYPSQATLEDAVMLRDSILSKVKGAI